MVKFSVLWADTGLENQIYEKVKFDELYKIPYLLI